MKNYKRMRTNDVEVGGRIWYNRRRTRSRHPLTQRLFGLLPILCMYSSSCNGFSIDSLKRNLFSKKPTAAARQPLPTHYYATTKTSNSTLLISNTLLLLDPKDRNQKLLSDENKQMKNIFLSPAKDTTLWNNWEDDWDQQHQDLLHQQEASNTVAPSTARLLLLSAAALYGTNFAAVKYLVDEIPVGVFGTLRFGLAALATLPWLWPTKNNDNAWSATLAGLEVGVWTSIGYVAQAVGLETTLASTSAFVCSLAVVVVPILDFLVHGKPLERKEQLYGIVMACIGVALLELGDTTAVGFTSGDALSLVQPFAFGIGFMRMERAMRLFPTEARRMTAGQLLAVFFTSATFMAVHPDRDFNLSTDLLPLLHDPMIWAGLVWTGIVTTGLTVYMETVALQTLSAAETTLIFSTEPLWGSVAAAFMLGESFGPKAMFGGGLIVTACLISNLSVGEIREFITARTDKKQQDTDT